MTGPASVGARFPNVLRSRAETIALAPSDAPVVWTVRVQAAEAYDAVRVTCTPDQTVDAVKRAGMAVLLPDMQDTTAYQVKVRGAEVHESATLAAAGVQDATTLFVTSRRRRPLK